MTSFARRRGIDSRRGQNLVEFAVSALLVVMLMLTVFEVIRMLWVYTTVSNAARMGARYATVHGADNAAASSSATNCGGTMTSGSVMAAVCAYIQTAPINASNATFTISYSGYFPGSTTVSCGSTSTNAGCPFTINVSYTYDPWIGYFGFPALTVSSQSQGIITY